MREVLCSLSDYDHLTKNVTGLKLDSPSVKDGQPQMDVNFYMVIADIYSADTTTPCTLVTNPVSSLQTSQSASISGVGAGAGPSTGQSVGESVLSLAGHSPPMASRNLTGSTVASGNLLSNLENETGVYFVFQDISVRSEGAYTLKFSFTLPPTLDGPPSAVMATVFSEPFMIYSAKRFPGMTESTALSKCFAKQGIKIPIRKEPRVSKSKRLAEQAGGSGGAGSDSDDDDDGQG
ncbi:hypothetical protein EDD11_001102 [Mortierella claussenii]|nr:hypothetical protein EDD11_001102 [Mortierella claussenii]